MPSNVVYIAPSSATSNVLKVGGACYYKNGPSSQSPTATPDPSSSFDSCDTCIGCSSGCTTCTVSTVTLSGFSDGCCTKLNGEYGVTLQHTCFWDSGLVLPAGDSDPSHPTRIQIILFCSVDGTGHSEWILQINCVSVCDDGHGSDPTYEGVFTPGKQCPPNSITCTYQSGGTACTSDTPTGVIS